MNNKNGQFQGVTSSNEGSIWPVPGVTSHEK